MNKTDLSKRWMKGERWMPGISLTMQPFFESEKDLGKQIDTRATWSFFHIALGEETLIHTKKCAARARRGKLWDSLQCELISLLGDNTKQLAWWRTLLNCQVSIEEVPPGRVGKLASSSHPLCLSGLLQTLLLGGKKSVLCSKGSKKHLITSLYLCWCPFRLHAPPARTISLFKDTKPTVSLTSAHVLYKCACGFISTFDELCPGSHFFFFL